jgi:hypothetical protein
MAVFTRHIHVAAGQWEIAQIMIEGCISPTGCSMADTAIRAKTTIMLVVLSVTGKTVGWRSLIDAIPMALLTTYFRVPAVKCESREVVVEFGRLPAIGGMANGTILPEPPLMSVVCTVACLTILHDSGKIAYFCRAIMAFYTFQFGMSADKLE